MSERARALILLSGALLSGLAVVLGAFGAHVLNTTLDPKRLSWWHTAAEYQMWHGLALVALSSVSLRRMGLAAALLGSGAVLFAASLYLMALTGWRWLGAVAPLGGIAMIAGWTLVAWGAVQALRLSR